jgi:hypothetical protein
VDDKCSSSQVISITVFELILLAHPPCTCTEFSILPDRYSRSNLAVLVESISPSAVLTHPYSRITLSSLQLKSLLAFQDKHFFLSLPGRTNTLQITLLSFQGSPIYNNVLLQHILSYIASALQQSLGSKLYYRITFAILLGRCTPVI